MLKKIEKSWNEFWAYFWRVTGRHQIPGIFEWDERLIGLIESTCRTTPSMKVLDLGCGGADQARVFAEKGYSVVGIDIAEPLIEHAKKSFKENGLTATFIVDDMRNITYHDEFDLCTLLSGTFGFFSDYDNFKLLKKIHRALKKNGKLFMMYLSPFRERKRIRTWKEIDGGYELSETWFDMETATYRGTSRLIMNDGLIIVPKEEADYHANEVIRCYANPEIATLLENAGFGNITHLSREHIDDPNASLNPWDMREIVAAEKV
jgi:ubiquinone/menaquinone biosynthesis C-methylase UbiE